MLPIHLILTMYIISYLGITLQAVYLFVAFAPAAADARTLQRWGRLQHPHSHATIHHVETSATKALTVWPDNADLTEVAEEEPDDWSKWRSEQDIQQDIRRKLECRSVEFGNCDVRRARREVTLTVLKNGDVDVGAAGAGGDDGERKGDDFVGVKLPRGLREFLASIEQGTGA
jgi:hypothetical protein